ncbi:hypothetical protein GQ53DRAFT_742084 [Thozetella sp. PMI_491]|nr:hypothetical protein GQ53DRAFT_742084 [Thozetella sp. PMI_491]
MAPAKKKSTFRELEPPPPDAVQQFLESVQDEEDDVVQRPRPRAAPVVMTTKQVKKAYLDRTRGPKLSKEERRRQELAELAKIKREEQEAKKQREKERAANKARILREKKREKEMKANEEKRKQGLPLVAVRPSQDMITRFFRGDPATKNHTSDDMSILSDIAEMTDDDDKDGVAAHQPHDGVNKQSRTTRDENTRSQEIDSEPEQAEARPFTPLTSISGNIQSKKRARPDLDAGSADEPTKTKVFIHSENDVPYPISMPQRLSGSVGLQSSGPRRGRPQGTPRPTPKSIEPSQAECQVPSTRSGPVRSSAPPQDVPESSYKSPDAPRSSRSRPSRSPLLMLAASHAAPQKLSQIPSQHPLQRSQHSRRSLQHLEKASQRSHKSSQKPSQQSQKDSQPSQHSQNSVPANNIPANNTPANKTPPTSFGLSRRVQWADKISTSPTQQPHDPPNQEFSRVPPSTQMFLLNNIDDLFPSATQEALELEGGACPPPLIQQDTESAELALICSQDLLISTQDMRDMDWDMISEASNSPVAQAAQVEEPIAVLQGSIEHDLECFGSQLLRDLSSDDLNNEAVTNTSKNHEQQREDKTGQALRSSVVSIDWDKALGLADENVDEDWFDF